MSYFLTSDAKEAFHKLNVSVCSIIAQEWTDFNAAFFCLIGD